MATIQAVFVDINPTRSLLTFVTLPRSSQIKRQVNKLYKLLELDVDGLYRYMLLLKKKKYAAVAASRGSDGVIHYTRELKGLDIVRRDWSQLSADCGS